MSLESYRAYLTRATFSPKTVEAYCSQIRMAAKLKDPVDRLLDEDLAPKTRWQALAALRSWAQFNGDTELLERLKDKALTRRLPKGDRVGLRLPLDRKRWKALVTILRRQECPADLVIGVEATRGLRVGDVLRLSRAEVREAVKSGRLRFWAKGRKRLEYDAQPCQDFLEGLLEYQGWENVRDLLSQAPAKKRQAAAYHVIWERLRALEPKIGLKRCELYTHRLRHTVASAFLQKLSGDPMAILKLQQWMMWSRIDTAEQYVRDAVGTELDTVGRGLV